MSDKIKKQVILNLLYVILGLIATNLGEAWRLAEGADISEKLLALFGILPAAFQNPLPSFHPLDLLIGLWGRFSDCCISAGEEREEIPP